MHAINIIVRNTALPISIEKKEAEAAQKVYQDITSAMASTQPQVIELTCDKQEGKKVAILSTTIAAVVTMESTGANPNRAAGFFAATAAE